MAQQADGIEPNMGDLIRELQRINQRLERLEHIPREQHVPPPHHVVNSEQGDTEMSSGDDDDAAPHRFGVAYQRRARFPEQPQTPDFGVKIDLPEFEGRMEPDEFLEWLQTVERIFEYKQIPQERRVSLVAIKLKKGASLWWENLKRARAREGRRRVISWEKMKRELQRKYVPAHYRQDLFLRLQSLQQRELSVEAYTAEFEQLMLKCDLHEPTEHTVARYLGGLNPAISNVVQLQPYWTLIDVQSLALKVEKQLQTSEAVSVPRQDPDVPPATPRFRKGDAKEIEKGVGSTTQPAKKCYRCHGFGHFAASCPNRNLITFTEHGVAIEKVEEGTEAEPKVEEVYLEADKGELLMLRRGYQIQEPTSEDPPEDGEASPTREE